MLRIQHIRYMLHNYIYTCNHLDANILYMDQTQYHAQRSDWIKDKWYYKYNEVILSKNLHKKIMFKQMKKTLK